MTLKMDDIVASSWSIDSRTIVPGDFFIALRGDNFDGHNYVKAALAKGAIGAMVDHPMPGPVVVVPDTQDGLENLGRQARREWGGTVVAVTGSAGKTSTKDIIAALVSGHFETAKTQGNLNNDIGVPLSILRIPDTAKVAVLEMGMNHLGEIEHLCDIAHPNIGVITNIGYAHIENFSSISEIAQAKGELIHSLGSDGIAILNADDPQVLNLSGTHPGKTITYGTSEKAEIRATDIEQTASYLSFSVQGTRFTTPLVGHHNLLNILAGIAVAQALNISLDSLQKPIQQLAPSKMRGERFDHKGIHILNDSYNSNPDAVKAMLDSLNHLPGQRKIAVLGEMLHRNIGQYAAAQNISLLIGVHGKALQMVEAAKQSGLQEAYFFASPEQAGEFLKTRTQEDDLILFKGSRGTRVEIALERFLA